MAHRHSYPFKECLDSGDIFDSGDVTRVKNAWTRSWYMEEQRRKQREARGLPSRSVNSGSGSGSGIGSLLAPIPATAPPTIKSSGLGALFKSEGEGSEHDQNQHPNTAGEGGAHTKLPFRRPPSYSKNLESAGEIAGAINTTPKAWEQHYTVYLNHLG